MTDSTRAGREKEIYNRGISREKYDSGFGHAGGGIAEADKKKMMREAISKRGKGGKVLELGSVSWKDYIDFRNAPQELICINISEKELEKGRASSEKIGTGKYCRHIFRIMDANHLEFEDNSFDVVYGSGILHHLDFGRAVREIYRVLKPDGVIVFQEPLARNPVGKFVRKRTPEARTPDEKPLDKEEFNILNQYFEMTNSYYQFFYVPAGVLSKKLFKSPDNFLMKAAYKTDCMLEKLFYRTNFVLWYRRAVILGIPKKCK